MRRLAVNLSISGHSRLQPLPGLRTADAPSLLQGRKMLPWFSHRKSTVGEPPEATNESLWDDIFPPVKRSCFRKLGRIKVFFAPTGRFLSLAGSPRGFS